jgi:hypothetical protein
MDQNNKKDDEMKERLYDLTNMIKHVYLPLLDSNKPD